MRFASSLPLDGPQGPHPAVLTPTQCALCKQPLLLPAPSLLTSDSCLLTAAEPRVQREADSAGLDSSYQLIPEKCLALAWLLGVTSKPPEYPT